MASKLQQLQAKAGQASQFVAKHGTSYYKQLLEQNKHYIQEPPTVEKCNELAKQLFYTRLARWSTFKGDMSLNSQKASSSFCIEETLRKLSSLPLYCNNIPGRTESFWKELDYVKNMWKHRQELKVEDAGIAALFGLECFAWFCAGEIVGRGFTFTGYYP